MKKIEPEKPNVPFYFKRLYTFLEDVKVNPVQQGELDLARQALKEILLALYGREVFCCSAGHVNYPPIGG